MPDRKLPTLVLALLALAAPLLAQAQTLTLADRAQIPYAVADQASATMTVRDGVNTARSTIARDQWKFNADATGVEYAAGT